eukprot:3566655-Rhodomonas_salina.4
MEAEGENAVAVSDSAITWKPNDVRESRSVGILPTFVQVAKHFVTRGWGGVPNTYSESEEGGADHRVETKGEERMQGGRTLRRAERMGQKGCK